MTSRNLYEPHVLMIDSGTFWRCDHGETGWYPCPRCGIKHPLKYLAHAWEEKRFGRPAKKEAA